jgi:hypothetical protein
MNGWMIMAEEPSHLHALSIRSASLSLLLGEFFLLLLKIATKLIHRVEAAAAYFIINSYLLRSLLIHSINQPASEMQERYLSITKFVFFSFWLFVCRCCKKREKIEFLSSRSGDG